MYFACTLMKLTSKEFNYYYEKLKEKFLKTEFPNGVGIIKKEKDYWDKALQPGGTPRFTDLFDVPPTYLANKFDKTRLSITIGAEVKTRVFTLTVAYLFGEIVDYNLILDKDYERKLYDRLKEQVYLLDKSKFKDDENDNNSEYIFIDPLNIFSSVTEVKALKTVSKFCENITKHNYQDAWKSLTQSLKSRDKWSLDFKKFESTFKNTKLLRNFSIIKIDPNIKTLKKEDVCRLINFELAYDEVISIPISHDIKLLNSLTFNDSIYFVEVLKRLKAKFAKSGISPMINYNISSLADPLITHRLLNKFNISLKTKNDLFSKNELISIRRNCICSLVKFEDEWFINSITFIPVYSKTHI